MVRSPLVYAGAADPVETTSRTRDNGSDIAAMRAVFTAWHAAFGRTPTRVRDAIKRAESDPVLHDALAAIALGKDGLDPRRLGNSLRKLRDRIADGLRLVDSDPGNSTSARWATIPC
jgi:hypothetical protein